MEAILLTGFKKHYDISKYLHRVSDGYVVTHPCLELMGDLIELKKN